MDTRVLVPIASVHVAVGHVEVFGLMFQGAPGPHSRTAISIQVQVYVLILIVSSATSDMGPVPLECRNLSDST